MSITIIKYGKTINTGDYNSERIDAEYQLAEGENPNTAMVKLKTFVNTGNIGINEEIAKILVETPKTPEAKVEKPAKKVKKEVKAPKKTETEKKLTEDLKKAAEVPAELPKEEKKVVSAQAKKTAKKEKIEFVTYDRTIKVHTQQMAATLTEHIPTWKTTHLEKAKALSVELIGTPIYDKKGVLLESFTEVILAKMA